MQPIFFFFCTLFSFIAFSFHFMSDLIFNVFTYRHFLVTISSSLCLFTFGSFKTWPFCCDCSLYFRIIVLSSRHFRIYVVCKIFFGYSQGVWFPSVIILNSFLNFRVLRPLLMFIRQTLYRGMSKWDWRLKCKKLEFTSSFQFIFKELILWNISQLKY